MPVFRYPKESKAEEAKFAGSNCEIEGAALLAVVAAANSRIPAGPPLLVQPTSGRTTPTQQATQSKRRKRNHSLTETAQA